MIIKLKITLKRAYPVLTRVNSADIKEQRKNYAISYLNDIERNEKYNVFVDESGFNIHMRRSMGRSPLGARTTFTVASYRGNNYTLICAITNKVVVHNKILYNTTKSQDFILFLRELKDKLIIRDELTKFKIFMDNASIHRSRISQEAINNSGLNIVYLTPYSYMCNPIEYSFSKIKFTVRRLLGEANDVDFIEIIKLGVDSITMYDLEGYFRHMRANLAKAILLLDFD